ncbi:MAG: MFS transporter [Verrucomicrobiales bacterium]
MTLLQTFMVVALPITGMCYAILGALKLPLADRLQLNEAKVGGLVSAFGLMVGPIILAAGFLTDALGRKGIMVAGALLVMTSLLLLSRTRRYGTALLAVAMLSAGWAAMINVANVLMYMAYDSVFMATNQLDALFGLGAFLTPVLVTPLLRRFGFSWGVSFFGALAAIPAVFALFVNMEALPSGDSAVLLTFRELISDPVMWLCGLSLMLWAPLESSTAAWTTTFVTKVSPAGEAEARAKRIAGLTLSGFWLGFMASRIVAAVIYHNFDNIPEVESARYVHIVIACLAIATVTVIVKSRSRKLTIGAILFAGLIYGPFFPNLMALLLSHFPVEVHGRAVGVLFACASVGWTVIPLVIGTVAKRTSINRGFVVAIVDGVLLLVVVVAHLIYAAS